MAISDITHPSPVTSLIPLASSLRPSQNRQRHCLSRWESQGERARVLGHREAFRNREDSDRKEISKAKPPPCPPFQPPTSLVPLPLRTSLGLVPALYHPHFEHLHLIYGR